MGVWEWLVTAQMWQVWDFERESLLCALISCSAAFSLLSYPTSLPSSFSVFSHRERPPLPALDPHGPLPPSQLGVGIAHVGSWSSLSSSHMSFANSGHREYHCWMHTQTANKHPHSSPPRKDVITRSIIFTVECCLFMGKSSGWHSEGTSLKTVYFKHNEIIVISKAGLVGHLSFLKMSYGK